LGVSGGTDRVKYYLSGAYLGDEGIINNSDFSRFSTRATVDYQAKKWLKIGTNLSYTYTTTNYSEDSNLDYSSSSGNAFFLANRIAPVYPMFVRDAEGNVMYNSTYNHPVYDYGDGSSTNYTRNFMSIANPIGSLLYDTTRTLHDVFDGKWYATLTPIEGLTITGNVGYYLSNLREHALSNPFYGQSAESGGFAEQYFARTRSINYQALASYNRTFADLHNFDIMAGYETYNLEREYAYAYGYNLYDPTGWNVSNVIDQISGKGARDIQYTTRGILARAKYNYASKYFGHVSYRRDASSRFAPGHRWGNFWSVSGAWDIAKESFMEQFTNVDHLKFKASFGQNGNDNLGSSTYYYYAWADQYQITGADGVWSDATLYYKGNPELTWETSNAFNIGFDFSFFQGKLSGSAEYFSRQTSDMLFNIPVAPSLGYTSYPANVGSMRNNGIEIELNANIINNKNIQWDVNANITTMGNKILSLPDYLEGEWIDGSRIYREGDSMYSLYLVKYAGVDSNTGEALYWGRYADGTVIDGVDVSGQEVKTTNWNACYSGDTDSNLVANRESTGSLLPKAYGGFGTTLRAYGFDFSLSFAYQFGGKIFDSSYQSLMHTVNSAYNGQNWHTDILNAWTPTNTDTDVPRVQYGDKYTASTSTRFLVSSNFLSLNNITLGYTLPSKLTRRIGISSLRFYGAAENVALWAKRKGLDPRQGYASSNNSTYSPIRTISGGLRVEF
jgi:TonB-linked SusC/RagA family outer membrane protein